jgi:hypothetical protein
LGGIGKEVSKFVLSPSKDRGALQDELPETPTVEDFNGM